jgi:hypothetical protein
MTTKIVAAGALVVALAAPSFAQGTGQGGGQQGRGQQGRGQQGKGPQGKGQGAPPSRNQLAPVASAEVPVSIATTPIAWVDDATLLAPGTVALSVSAVRWSGVDVSEVDAPIVSAAMGLTPRVQLGASVPRTIGSSDPTGAAGGVGTSVFGAKVQVFSAANAGVKLAATPTLLVLGEGVAAALGPNEGRARWGLPVSAEVDRGALRLYGGGGYFSPGLWFTGAAFAVQAAPKLIVNAGVSRAWRTADQGVDIALSDRDRKEVTGGAAYVLASHLVAFGSIGRTFATLDENGAGTTLSGGVSIWFLTVK